MKDANIIISISKEDVEYELLRLENCLNFNPLKEKLKEYKFNFNPKGNYEQKTIDEILSLYDFLRKRNGLTEDLTTKCNNFAISFSENCYQMFLKDTIPKEREAALLWVEKLRRSGIDNKYLTKGLLNVHPNNETNFLLYQSVILPHVRKLKLEENYLDVIRNELHKYLELDYKKEIRKLEGTILLLSVFGDKDSKIKIANLMPKEDLSYNTKDPIYILYNAIGYTYNKLNKK